MTIIGRTTCVHPVARNPNTPITTASSSPPLKHTGTGLRRRPRHCRRAPREATSTRAAGCRFNPPAYIVGICASTRQHYEHQSRSLDSACVVNREAKRPDGRIERGNTGQQLTMPSILRIIRTHSVARLHRGRQNSRGRSARRELESVPPERRRGDQERLDNILVEHVADCSLRGMGRSRSPTTPHSRIAMTLAGHQIQQDIRYMR